MNTPIHARVADSLGGSRSKQNTVRRRWFIISACGIVAVLCFGIGILALVLFHPWANISTTTRSVSGPICGVWQTISMPSAGPLTCCIQFNGLAVTKPDDVWALGEYHSTLQQSGVVIMHWDGKSWVQKFNANLGSETSHINDAVAIAEDDVWAVGSASYQALMLRWDGTRWTLRDHPDPVHAAATLSGIDALAQDDIWTVGEQVHSGVSATFTMHWDGSSWQIIPSPNPPSAQAELKRVKVFAADDAWAVGSYWAANGPTQSLAMHWDGAQWTIIPTPNPCRTENELEGVAGSDQADIWAVGSCRDTIYVASRTLVLHWDGQSWAEVPSPHLATVQGLAAIAVLNKDDAWAVGGYGDGVAGTHPLALHWEGRTWASLSVADPQQQAGLTGIAVVAKDEFWTVGNLDSASPPASKGLIAHFRPAACPGAP